MAEDSETPNLSWVSDDGVFALQEARATALTGRRGRAEGWMQTQSGRAVFGLRRIDNSGRQRQGGLGSTTGAGQEDASRRGGTLLLYDDERDVMLQVTETECMWGGGLEPSSWIRLHRGAWKQCHDGISGCAVIDLMNEPIGTSGGGTSVESSETLASASASEEGKELSLVLKTTSGKVCNVIVTEGTLVGQLLEKVAVTSQATEWQTMIDQTPSPLFVHRGLVLHPQKAIRDCNLVDGSAVFVVARPTSGNRGATHASMSTEAAADSRSRADGVSDGVSAADADGGVGSGSRDTTGSQCPNQPPVEPFPNPFQNDGGIGIRRRVVVRDVEGTAATEGIAAREDGQRPGHVEHLQGRIPRLRNNNNGFIIPTPNDQDDAVEVVQTEEDGTVMHADNGEGGEEEEDRSEGQCRICLGGIEEGRLISPCLCRGTVRLVHVECLNAWRQASANPASLVRCDQCGYKYRVVRTQLASYLLDDRLITGVAFALFCLLLIFAGLVSYMLGIGVDLWFYEAVAWRPWWWDQHHSMYARLNPWHVQLDVLVAGGVICGLGGMVLMLYIRYQQHPEHFVSSMLPGLAFNFAAMGMPIMRIVAAGGLYVTWRHGLYAAVRQKAKEALVTFGERVLEVQHH